MIEQVTIAPLYGYKRIVSNGHVYIVSLLIPIGSSVHYVEGARDRNTEIAHFSKRYLAKSSYRSGETSDGHSSAFSRNRKMRADKAEVLSIVEIKAVGDEYTGEFINEPITNVFAVLGRIAKKTTYRTGDIVYPDKFSMLNHVCTPGIHFFMSIDDALTYR